MALHELQKKQNGDRVKTMTVDNTFTCVCQLLPLSFATANTMSKTKPTNRVKRERTENLQNTEIITLLEHVRENKALLRALTNAVTNKLINEINK